MSAEAKFRSLPAVDALLAAAPFQPLLLRFGRSLLTEAIRADIDLLREGIRKGTLEDVDAVAVPTACAERIGASLARRTQPAYRRAINGTGVILHTGLGRAPLPKAGQAALAEAARGFTVLEIETGSGKRGRRDDGITRLVTELTGAEAACVVNNNAGATLICLAALAPGRPVIVSRGQLVEIGGSFRIPDVMAQSGALLVEVGSTNRTHLKDYEQALDAHPDTALLLRVHTSNFEVVGFTKEVALDELTALGKRRGVEVMDDLGSGCLIDLSPYGLAAEPLVSDSLETGAGVVTFSGDKLLGGPQAGVIVGRKDLVAKIRAHPLYRALRPDKLILSALEASLSLYRDLDRVPQTVPAVRMIALTVEQIDARANALSASMNELPGLDAQVEDGTSKVGGGSYAVEALPTRVVSLLHDSLSVDQLAARLRAGTPSVFTRVQEGRLRIDPRTLLEGEDSELLDAVRRAVGSSA